MWPLWSVARHKPTTRWIRVVVVTYLRIHSGKQLHPVYPEVAKKLLVF